MLRFTNWYWDVVADAVDVVDVASPPIGIVDRKYIAILREILKFSFAGLNLPRFVGTRQRRTAQLTAPNNYYIREPRDSLPPPHYHLSAAHSLVMLSAAVAALSLAVNPSLKLNNGVMMPQLAAGTWQYSNATAKDSIAKAVAAGFTHIDTAENYGNQIGVGQELAALFAAGTVKRSDLFITTKTLPCDSGKLTHAECMAQVCLFLFLILSLSQPFFISPWLTTAPSSCLRRSVTLRATSPISDLTTST